MQEIESVPRTTETLSLRVPREEVAELRRRASEAGCSLNTYLRERLSREHEDTSAAVAIAASLSEKRFEMLETAIEEERKSLEEKISKLAQDQASRLAAILEALKPIYKHIQEKK